MDDVHLVSTCDDFPGRLSLASPTSSEAGPSKEVRSDLESTLQHVIKMRDEANIKPRELGVVFRDLRVVGLGASTSYQPTLGSVLNPLNILDVVQDIRHPPTRDILAGFEGVVQPGEMLLVLGRPGSGCSTLLKALANQRGEYHSVEGAVHYDSFTPADIAKYYRGDVQYCPEEDVHFPTLTVEQTLRFAAKSRAPKQRLDHSRAEYTELVTDVLTTTLGLRHARKTPIGNAFIRGISGGEKKRVSIGEALATRSCIGAWDNTTRGLDSSTALEFVQALRIATDLGHLSTIASLYQAGESLYQLFDKVCVIYEGRMAYFGPADQARQYFLDMGYEPANRQTTADFLVAVTDPKGRIPRAGFFSMPRTAVEYAEYFLGSPAGHQNRAEIGSYCDEFVGKPERATAYRQSVLEEHAKTARMGSPYTISILMQARLVMTRRVQILRGNMLTTGIQLFSSLFQSIIFGTAFLRVPESTSAYYSRGGILFFALLSSALAKMAEIPTLFSQRPIVLRHQNWALYHPFFEAVALTLVDMPISFAISLVFAVILYEAVRLQQSAAQFFTFFLFLFTTGITMKAWFRALASACKSEAMALSLAGISILSFSIYTGYTIPKPSMIGALRWITYVNPFRYGFEAIMANEFHTINGSCTSLIPQGPGYEDVSLENQVCTSVGSLSGQAFVDGNRFVELSYGYSYANIWRNFGIVVGFWLAFILALFTFTEYNTKMAAESAVVLFKGSKVRRKSSVKAADEEKSGLQSEDGTLPYLTDTKVDAKEVPARYSRTNDVFSWAHVVYDIPITEGEHRRLLDDVSGFVAPGKLTALMGETGAGKTTLLNVLAQRIDIGIVTGDRLVNGQPLPADFQSQTGYCQQMDTHLPTATVREALLFSAKLRQPASVPLAEKEEYVEKCLKMCGLEAYGDAVVGSLGIEHRKRTTIGVELAAKPKLLLFLDEPTSGLDSQSAWGVVSFLRNLADSGQAILCTIHQPSAELFQVFDRLLLLRKGGQTVYFGDIGHNATTVINYFEKNGSRPCEPEENPAEFILDVIGAGAASNSKQDWYDIWRHSKESLRVQETIEVIHANGRNKPPVKSALHTEFARSWSYQTAQLIRRGAQNYWRDPTYLMAKLVLNIFGGLFIGFTFFKSKDTQLGTQDKLFAIFMATVLSVPLSNQLQVPFLKMRAIYEIRERPSRMYSWTALITSQILVEVPWNILGSSLFFFTWYWTVGFPNSRSGYTYLLFGVIFPIYYTTIGQSLAAMSPTAEIAAMLFSSFFSLVIIFNGVIQPYRELGWWRWMYRLSPSTYLIEGLLGQAIGNQNITCSPIELVSLNPPPGQTCGGYMEHFIASTGGYLTNPGATSSCQFCSVRTTNQYLESDFNIFYSNRWRNIGIMMAFVIFNVTTVYLFTYLFRIRTGSLLSPLRKRLAAPKSS